MSSLLISSTCQVAFHPLIELVSAYWTTLEKSGIQGAPHRLVEKSDVDTLIQSCLSEWEQEKLRQALDTLGLYRSIGLVIGEIDPGSFGANEQLAAAYLAELAGDSELHRKAAECVAPMYEKLNIDSTAIEEMHLKSDYAKTPLLRTLLKGELEVLLYPTLFMTPAPTGKMGYFSPMDSGGRLAMAFGYNGQIVRETYLDWLQWYRMGIWHMSARLFWEEALNEQFLSEQFQKNAFEQLPRSLISKVGIHESKVTYHKHWRSYLIDHLIQATKVLCEESISGSQGANEQEKWFVSLGRFHLPWFLEHMRKEQESQAHSVKGLGELIEQWTGDLDSLKSVSPLFSGPLGACENPLWIENPRIVFSPSIDRVTRRTLKMWFQTYYPVKDVPVAECIPGTEDWDEHCNLVFALTEDKDWLEYVSARCAQDTYVLDETEALTYVFRNGSQPKWWTRVSIGSTVESLMSAHTSIKYFSDWTKRTGTEWTYGPVQYDADGKVMFLK